MPSHPLKTPNEEKGYDFAQHFNLFSQYTSNMALEYCVGGRMCEEDVGERGEELVSLPPPVWCMAVRNKVIALGCGDGKVEVSESDICVS